jgi:hypothetical protein
MDMIKVSALLLVALMAGCSTMPGEYAKNDAYSVTVVNMCLGLCEYADRLERFGDSENTDSEISEEINEGMESEQGEEGALDVTPL